MEKKNDNHTTIATPCAHVCWCACVYVCVVSGGNRRAVFVRGGVDDGDGGYHGDY